MEPLKFKALQISEVSENKFESELIERDVNDLPAGDVLIEVYYSSVNYKDALSANGNKGVTRQYPHTPGIDSAGIVRATSSDLFQEGEEVIVNGYDLGMNTAGGFGQFVRVPAAWVVSCPRELGMRNSMILGTAGFTAALCIEKLIANGLSIDSGNVLVTGASGGVGIVAVMLLNKLDFQVVASTGKTINHNLLKELGAIEVIDRSELSETSARPLLKERWGGAVDVVGGDTLFNVIKALNYGTSVAACGLVQSVAFQASVLPFILRGVNLLGIDSVELPLERKKAVWERLASDWYLPNLERICTEIGFDQLEESLMKVLHGEATGRYLLNLQR